MWIIITWQFFSAEVTAKGFKKYCISIAVDETDGMLWNGSAEVGNIRSGCEEDEGTDCEVGESDTDW
jgi:hypothetical protein